MQLLFDKMQQLLPLANQLRLEDSFLPNTEVAIEASVGIVLSLNRCELVQDIGAPHRLLQGHAMGLLLRLRKDQRTGLSPVGFQRTHYIGRYVIVLGSPPPRNANHKSSKTIAFGHFDQCHFASSSTTLELQ